MKFTLALFFLVPNLSFAMGMFYRPAMQSLFGTKTGINPKTCAFTYDGQTLVQEYDPTCMAGKHSRPIDVSSDCNYDDYDRDSLYKPTPGLNYVDPVLRIHGEHAALNVTNAKIQSAFQNLKLGIVKLEPFWQDFENSYKDPQGYLENELLLGKYCQRSTPTNTSQAFAINTDVPAQIISFWDQKYLKAQWKPILEPMKKQYPEFEIQEIYDMNLQAADLWDKVMKCSNQDPEASRFSYFTGEFNCPNGSELKEEIKNYVLSVRMQLTTAYKKPIEPTSKSGILLSYAISQGQAIYKNNYPSLPSYHPLYTQALLQIMVDVFPAGTHDKVSFEEIKKRLGVKSADECTLFLQNIGQLDDLQPEGLIPMGLWPTAGITAYTQVQTTRMKLMATLLKDITVTDFSDIYIIGFRKPAPFYTQNRAQFVDEIRKMNQRYGIAN